MLKSNIRDYKCCHPSVYSQRNSDGKILLQNQKCQDRKNGKFTYKWLGSCTVANITKTVLCALMNKKGETLRKKCNVNLLKRYF